MQTEFIDDKKIAENVEGKYPQYIKSYANWGVRHVYDLGGGVISDSWKNFDEERDQPPYRIESYIHSDSVSPNKAGALVKLTAQTDFAVKTEEFALLCKKVARYACGFQTNSLTKLFSETDLELEIKKVSEKLKEKIEVVFIGILR